MQYIGLLIVAIGGLMALVFALQLLIEAFRTSVPWGLGYMFVPFVSLVFVAMHWEGAKKPFIRAMMGVLLVLLGIFIGPSRH